MTILGMIVTDAYLLCKGCTGDTELSDQSSFMEQLALGLIENSYDRIALRTKRRSREVTVADIAPQLTINTASYLTSTTPTKKRKKKQPAHCTQGRCMIEGCKKQPTTVCRECQQHQPNVDKKQYYICRNGSACFHKHLREFHKDKIVLTPIR